MSLNKHRRETIILLTLYDHFKASLLQAWEQASDFSGYAGMGGLQWVGCGG